MLHYTLALFIFSKLDAKCDHPWDAPILFAVLVSFAAMVRGDGWAALILPPISALTARLCFAGLRYCEDHLLYWCIALTACCALGGLGLRLIEMLLIR